ncbi:MAG: RdgB/HAM1 family non-canonical purine NTP pyrophosphatase [Succinivibrionaceae bacterium]|nr:RdgB/HAM1 family non-canonical purine NTP pyrophosphatase [Succinivibrionaceae bacterium]
MGKLRMALASHNAGKAREFSEILSPLGVELILPGEGVPSPEETGRSFVENALQKARFVSERMGMPALADDSGLAVDALGGAPGIHSARFAGPGAPSAANNALLLERLRGIAEGPGRSARFHCALAFVEGPDDPTPLIAEGSWEGTIALAPRGEGGFGYDPLFIARGRGLTAAQLPAGVKNLISHRARATRLMLALLRGRHARG